MCIRDSSRVSHSSAPADQLDFPRADVAVVHDPWGSNGPINSPGVIADLKDTVSLIVVVTQVLADDGSGDEEDYEADVQRMLVSGASIPTERDVRAALHDAGFEVESRQSVGWGPIRFVARRVG